MADLPAFLQPHTVTVTTRLGANSAGPVMGEPVTVACMREDKARLVRAQNGDQVVSSTTIRTSDPRDLWTLGSTVEWDWGAGTVLTVARHDDGGLGGWCHTEIALT